MTLARVRDIAIRLPPLARERGCQADDLCLCCRHPLLLGKQFGPENCTGRGFWVKQDDRKAISPCIASAHAPRPPLLERAEAEKRGVERDLERYNAELRQLAARLATGGTATDRVADLQDRIRSAQQRLTQVRKELIALDRKLIDEKEVARLFGLFYPVWETLSPREQVRVIRLLVQRVDYDGEKGTVSVTFHPAGIKTLADELEEVNG